MSEESKWSGFEHPSYRIVDIGRTFVFYIPVAKLDIPSKEEGTTVRGLVHSFLKEQFGGGNVDPIPREGFWVNAEKQIFFDNCVRYSVSFLGKERMVELLIFLRALTAHIGEECLFISAGQYDALLYPTPAPAP